MSQQPVPQPVPRGVIHDLGYRGYIGPRERTGTIALDLFVTGLRHCFGLGRSGRSKVLPFILLGINLLPAIVMFAVVTIVGGNEFPLSYAAYASQMQMLVSLFASAQAPVLFSRDLRHRSIVLYLARPLPAAVFAIVRWASLLAATWLFMLLPTLVMYAGGLLAGLDVGEQTPLLVKAVVLQLLVAALLAGLTGLISSWALRRGFAVVVSIVALLVVVGIVLIVQGIADHERIRAAGELAGLFSPWTIHNGLAEAWSAEGPSIVDLTTTWVVAYVFTAVALVAGSLLLLVQRFTKVGSR